jgi:RNA polymerase sigma factor (sigma-70 family)
MEKAKGSQATSPTAEVNDQADEILLDRVAAQRDEAAFAALVRRYGPSVLGVCRRVVHHEQDAEDAFQATFLVLYRQAVSIRKRQAVGSWLYGVAYRIARKVQAKRAKHAVRETELTDIPAPESRPPWLWRELRLVLDEEVNRLPTKYRVPFVLCYIEGKTTEEAARQTGCPLGTVSSRLAWSRKRLRSRLLRRGMMIPAALVTAILAERVAAVALPDHLLNSTGQAAATFAVAPAGAAKAAGLANSFLRAQSLWKWTKATGLLAGVGLVILLALFLRWALKPETDQELLQGEWKATRCLFAGKELPPNMEVRIAGDHFNIRFGDASKETTFRLNPGKQPKEIDFISAPGIVNPGIYRLEDDRLLLSMNMQGPERPTDFTGERFFLYEFRRVK